MCSAAPRMVAMAVPRMPRLLLSRAGGDSLGLVKRNGESLVRVSHGLIIGGLLIAAACTTSSQSRVADLSAPVVPSVSGEAYAGRLGSIPPEQALTFPSPASFIDASGLLPASPHSGRRPISQPGDYTHPGSGLVFPVSVGEMRRVSLLSHYDHEEGVVAAYEFPEFPSGSPRVLVDVGPIWVRFQERVRAADIAKSCQTVFDAEKFQAPMLLSNARAVGDDAETSIRFPDAALSRVVTFDAAADLIPPASPDSPPVRAETHVICGAGKVWVVTYRITYPQNMGDSAFVSAFMRAVPSPSH